MSYDGKNINLRNLTFSPKENPFMTGSEIKTKTKTVRTRNAPSDLMNTDTGEIIGQSIIHTIEEKDEEHFVKVFEDGVKAAFGLNRTGARVFQAVLTEYRKEKMTGGYADTVSLYFFDDGLNGESIGMSEKSFQRGLKDLIAKDFLRPKIPNQYWVNPALFFKGDRVAFIRELRIKKTNETLSKFDQKKIKK